MFWRVSSKGKEEWVTPDRFDTYRQQSKTQDKLVYERFRNNPNSRYVQNRIDFQNRNRDKKAEYDKVYQLKYSDRRLQARRAWKNQPGMRDYLRGWMREYRKNNADSCRKRSREYVKERAKRDLLFKLLTMNRSRMSHALRSKGFKKSRKTEAMLGCTIPFYRRYLEERFLPGMTWENRGKGIGKWEVDHEIELWTAKSEEELIKLFHYTNTRPFWWIDNIQKSIKLRGTLWR